jgi:hypothetical protein
MLQQDALNKTPRLFTRITGHLNQMNEAMLQRHVLTKCVKLSAPQWDAFDNYDKYL